VAVAAGLSAAAYSKNGHKPAHLTFLGQAIFPTATTFQGTTVGGLSEYHLRQEERGLLQPLGTDQGQLQPARFYTLTVNLSDGHLDNGDVNFTGVTTLLAPDGKPVPGREPGSRRG
jgi:3-phytase/alkaline phosphatase D